jgi:hypothetical protein
MCLWLDFVTDYSLVEYARASSMSVYAANFMETQRQCFGSALNLTPVSGSDMHSKYGSRSRVYCYTKSQILCFFNNIKAQSPHVQEEDEKSLYIHN